MCSFRSTLVFCLFIGVTIAKNITGESIGFPEREEDFNSVNKDNRQPVYLPSMCPVNELFYPGDQQDDWICDCRPAFIYHPKSDRCWPAYRQGPCAEKEYLVLPKNSPVPVCEKNPCGIDNYVKYKERCEQLSSVSACVSMWPIPAALAINATTLAITCERINLESRFGADPPKLQSRFGEEAPAKITVAPCPPGCKRSINGKCVAVKP